jgi:hypothetical protein
LAKKASDLNGRNDPRYTQFLAAAFAEAGDYDRAIELQRKVVASSDLAQREGPLARALLNLFEKHQPYRLDMK